MKFDNPHTNTTALAPGSWNLRALFVLGVLASVGVHECAAAAAASSVSSAPSAASPDRQSRDDAWWTGPLLAPSAGTLPRGHFLIEPYLFDSMPQGRYDARGTRRSVPHQNNFGSQSYVIYGLTDRMSVGLIPRFGFNAPAEGRSSSRIGVGDLGLQWQYGLSRFEEGGWIPTTSLVIGETLPTGKYDRLGDRPADGLGAGAYTTTLAVYSQYFFWLPNGRIVRTRLDLSYAASNSVNVQDVSVYGTGPGFRGRAHPGNSFLADASWEYSATRNWVLALDLVVEHDSNTRVGGLDPQDSVAGIAATIELNSGPSRSLSLAPAVEYNFNSRIGVIAGAKFTLTGRNTSAVIIPVAAVNMVL
ncbi:MAG: transporter [Steroidobacteraceae bacterium]